MPKRWIQPLRKGEIIMIFAKKLRENIQQIMCTQHYFSSRSCWLITTPIIIVRVGIGMEQTQKRLFSDQGDAISIPFKNSIMAAGVRYPFHVSAME
jgi:hypothetical protein